MKNHIQRIRLLLIALMVVTSMQGKTIQATIDDIVYSLNTDTQTATVTGADGNYLHTLNIPEQVIYENADYTVTKIGDGAFKFKTALTNITLPATLTKIGEEAFLRCTSLTHIFCYTEKPIPLNTGSVYWEEEPYTDCTIHVKPGKAEAFRKANVWKKFKNIEDNIDAVKIEVIDNIPYFLDAEKKTAAVMKRDFYYGGHIMIPEEVTSDGLKYAVTAIEHGAFYSGDRNNPIRGLTLPKSMTKIGQYALHGISTPIYCYSETPATVYENSFYTPYNVIHVKPGAGEAYRNADVWKNCPNIVEDLTYETVSIDENVYLLSDEPQKTATLIFCRNQSGDIRIPDNVSCNGTEYTVTGIGDNTFGGASELTGITLPENLKSIGNNAFAYCDKLAAVVLPSSLTDIGNEAFYDCNLTAVTLPSSLTNIGDYTFANCSALSDVTLPEGITSLGFGMFYGCSALTDITLPQSLEIIEYNALRFTNLTSITLPPHLELIGNFALSGCKNLTDIQVSPQNNHYTSIDGVLFSSDRSTLVIYPSGKENTAYTVPENVTEIESTAFSSCYNLTRITLPQGVTAIKYATFYDCTGLTDINIPEEAYVIDIYAFAGCTKLTRISLPQSICFIGESAFDGCYLMNIYSRIDNPLNVEFSELDGSPVSPWTDGVFSNCTLHVKPGLGDAYRNADVWKNFANIVDDLAAGVEDIKADDHNYIELSDNSLTIGGSDWTVHSVDGRIVAQGTSKRTLSLPTGVYVARCGNTVKKVFIK